MRSTSACLSLLLLAIDTSVAGTALEALKFLSPEQLQRVAIIAGRDGTPEPERWHIVVYDPASKDTGLREIVVAGGKKVADRPVSQFAEKLSAIDALSPDALKIDSDKLEKLAMKYGSVNSTTVSAMHFDLRKTGPESGALWTVTCLDSSGTELGKLIVSATKGNVLLHPGFRQYQKVLSFDRNKLRSVDRFQNDFSFQRVRQVEAWLEIASCQDNL